MSFGNEPFEQVRMSIGGAIAHLESLGPPLENARTSLQALDGAIGRYCEVFYPLPYKRPDEEVQDIVDSAEASIRALIERVSLNVED